MAFVQTGPSLSNADVSIAYEMMTTITFRRSPSLLSFSTQQYAATLQNNYGSIVNVPDLSASTTASRGVGDPWDKRSELGASQIGLVVNKHRENGFKVRYNTANEVPWDVVAQGEDAIANSMAIDIESDYHTYLAGLTTKTITGASDPFGTADVPADNGGGDNGNAGKIAVKKYGSAGNVITRDGSPSGTAAGFIFDALQFGLTRFQRLHVRNGVQIGGMLDNMSTYFLLPVELFNVLVDWALAKNLDWNALNESGYLTQGLFSRMDFQGELRNVKFLTPTVLPAPTANNANNPWVAYMGFAWATSYHPRPIFRADWGAAENQTEPFAVRNQLCDYGFQLLQHQGLIRFEFATAASSRLEDKADTKKSAK